MIINCKACEKKFVVPDQAIPAKGRLVQCSSCGNKWEQFPLTNKTSKIYLDQKIKTKKVQKKRIIKKSNKKNNTKEVSLYSPEYLEKKHGISLKSEKSNHDNLKDKNISFGFYNVLILFIVITIAGAKALHFFQDILVEKAPFTEFYLNYFFESIRNIFEIWKNLIANY